MRIKSDPYVSMYINSLTEISFSLGFKMYSIFLYLFICILLTFLLLYTVEFILTTNRVYDYTVSMAAGSLRRN